MRDMALVDRALDVGLALTCETCARTHAAAMRSDESDSWMRALVGHADGCALVGIGVPACGTCWTELA